MSSLFVSSENLLYYSFGLSETEYSSYRSEMSRVLEFPVWYEYEYFDEDLRI